MSAFAYKLPPLPKLPRNRESHDGLRLPRTAKARDLPDLPVIDTRSDGPIAEDEVSPKDNNWGGTNIGQWFETTDARHSVGGRCCRCGGLKPAYKLRYALGPFGRWEGWACGPCRNERKGVEFSKQARKGKTRKAPNFAKPLPPTEYEKARTWLKSNEHLMAWEGEGGATWA